MLGFAFHYAVTLRLRPDPRVASDPDRVEDRALRSLERCRQSVPTYLKAYFETVRLFCAPYPGERGALRIQLDAFPAKALYDVCEWK